MAREAAWNEVLKLEEMVDDPRELAVLVDAENVDTFRMILSVAAAELGQLGENKAAWEARELLAAVQEKTPWVKREA